MRLLLVEDDPLLGDGLQRALRADGYTVDWVDRGDQVLSALQREHFDLVLLDIGLPGLDGIQVLKKLRGGDSPIPVIVVSARDTLDDRVAGLDGGADDYLTKPFELDELRARIRARLRRGEDIKHEEIQLGELVIRPQSQEVFRDGELISLPRREFTLFLELVRSRGRVLTRERLEQALYGWSGDVESNALEVHIHHLRKKLGSDVIRTVRGVGYSVAEQ
ncbi:MAG: response regulator transcription factor [Alcanivoracaceae bacterium]|nr:response regulator transcription factor [Alcanivoracaceae bacterium]